MECQICFQDASTSILRKPETPIWTNAPDNRTFTKELACSIDQCQHCGHVFQPLSQDQRNYLDEVYQSAEAQLSTPLGVGNWGQERANGVVARIIRGVGEELEGKKILELGCGNGFVLGALKAYNPAALLGIEPSTPEGAGAEGIQIIRAYADSRLVLTQTYDVIIAVGVLEHVFDCQSILSFTEQHLSPAGSFYVEVPNAEPQLAVGDPNLFVHEHIHHFTDVSLENLLAQYGFTITGNFTEGASLCMTTTGPGASKQTLKIQNSFSDYETRLHASFANAIPHLASKKCLIHGVNNALNNLLAWYPQVRKDHLLVDNDGQKIGKTYFGRLVQKIGDIELGDVDTVLVVPCSFFKEISAQYRSMGFQGEIVNLMTKTP